MSRTGLIVVTLVLLVGAAAAFAWTEKLKLRPARVAQPDFTHRFSPTCGCSHAKAHLTFVVRRRERLDVAIVDADGHYVATLAQGLDRGVGPVSFRWDGKDASGSVVPDGTYRVRVRLERDRRTILIPAAIVVDTAPPVVRLLGPAGPVSLDRAAGTVVTIPFRVSETAKPLLYVDGKVVLRGAEQKAGRGKLEWDGTRRGKPVAAGSHELTVVVVDKAGNRSQPAGPVTVQAT